MGASELRVSHFHYGKGTSWGVQPFPCCVFSLALGQRLGPVLRPTDSFIQSINLSPYSEHLLKAVQVDTAARLPGLESWLVCFTNCANLVKFLNRFVPPFPHLHNGHNNGSHLVDWYEDSVSDSQCAEPACEWALLTACWVRCSRCAQSDSDMLTVDLPPGGGALTALRQSQRDTNTVIQGQSSSYPEPGTTERH